MATVTLHDVRKKFGAVDVIKGVSVDIEDGEFVILVGPSGCGKSTLLRMIAGLEDVTSGDVAIDNKRINHVPPKDRDIAMVFQNYALYPHMTVEDNMGFSLKLAGVSKADRKTQVAAAAASLGLTDYLHRYPKELSGGQRQRVATGRAIVRNPKVFLFDEPLSNLDAALRVQMRSEIRELQNRLGVTSIYVTHDQIEAMTMADKIVLLRGGVVEQVGPPLELYDRPNSTFVATFMGSPSMNLFEGAVSDGSLRVFDDYAMPLPGEVRADSRMTLGLRPDAVSVATQEVPGSFRARVTSLEATGSETMLFAERDGRSVTVVVKDRLAARAGDAVFLVPDPAQAHFFDAEGRRAH
ncbi:ABC transporter ATP-binding protein [Oceaniglobus trochenteri]|uniref:ABC transporter ATP-binding protein n=1 Tax=Oceaniglobus trochenteri TaxID=2763260 RepID=UPI001CFFB03D|nr:sn-glycerol-3-phosphate ABC transporter ATP-binding protein UgpC [Oceaniglobus trochenteri]